MNLKDKRVLITGADGFIGSHLAERLVQEGANVTALTIYNSMGSWGWLDGSPYKREMNIIAGDVRDSHCCEQITKGIDVVFNLAALIAIPYSYTAPDSYIDTNVRGALNICQASRLNACEKIIQTSTSEVYGTAKYVPIDEKHPMQPQSPYSASKIGADAIALSFFHSFNLNVTLARPFNTYGPRQSARAIIPAIITQIASGCKKLQLGALSPTRDFNYILDTCEGFVRLAECDAAVGKSVNIGSNFEISIGETANKIKSLMGSDIEIVTDEQRLRPEGSEVNRLWCDNNLIKVLTGFEPAFSIDEGLRETIEWFLDKANLRHYKGEMYNV